MIYWVPFPGYWLFECRCTVGDGSKPYRIAAATREEIDAKVAAHRAGHTDTLPEES